MPARRPGRRPIPKSKRRSVRVVVSLRRDEMRRLERVARASETPVAVFVRDALIEALDEREKELAE